MTYPFTPEILDALPDRIAKLFRELEDELLQYICEQLASGNGVNEVTLQDIRTLRSHGIPLDEIEKAIKQTSELSAAEIDNLFNEVVLQNIQYYGQLMDLSDVTAPETLVSDDDINAIVRQTKGDIKNITQSQGFVTRSGKTVKAAEAYQWALDNAAIKVQSGAVSYQTAISDCVKELADSGLKTVEYESGHKDSVDVAVRRAVLTGINQLNQRYGEQSLEYLETDLVEVTAHAGARDKGEGINNHKEWQGKVYRWSEKPRTSTGNYPDFVKKTGYGQGAGLCGWNCRHHWYPFVEGVSVRTYTDEQLKSIDKSDFMYEGKSYTAYEATQFQRNMERTIRKFQRERLAYEAVGDTDKATAINIRINRLKQKYKEFSKAAGLKERTQRMNVDFTDNNSVKSVANSGESGIIKSIDVDDYETVTYDKNISDEVSSVILDTMKNCENDSGFIISEISAKSISTVSGGTPVLQIEPLSNGLLQLNLNTDVLSGKSLQEINELFLSSDSTVVNSLKEAVIHESGHAVSIKGKSVSEIQSLYDELFDIHIDGVSDIAYNDGAECLAELEVLRSRDSIVSKEAMSFYEKYMGRKYK